MINHITYGIGGLFLGTSLEAAHFRQFSEPTPVSRAGLAPSATKVRGAITDFVTYEAEDSETNGIVIGPDRTPGTLATESSGRRAVRLAGPGQGVDFILAQPADAITIRYAIPDSADGKGLSATAALFGDNRLIGTLPLTSRYSWYYGKYPFTNRPAAARAHHFYDHVRLKLGQVLPRGTRLSIRLTDQAPPWAVIDLVDLEMVPTPRKPPGDALSVLHFGADPSGRRSSARAFRAAIAAGRRRGQPVWIAPGEYRIDGHLSVDRVRMLGAGHWHSVLRGRGVGLYGLRSPRSSQNVELRDFAIIGEVSSREDSAQLAGIGGALSNSNISGLWIQHTKVGLWLDGPLDRLTVSDLRILDQAADGINFHGGVTNSVVRNSFIRNSGDDGLAMWSHRTENRSNTFSHNTIVAPVLANGIAIYGGRDILVADNLVADAVTEGGGLHIGSRFNATAFAGDIVFERNTVARSGMLDPNWKFGVGAFWIYALDHPIVGARVTVRDLTVIDSGYAAIQFLGKRIEGVTIDGVAICGAGTSVLQVQAPGQATFGHVFAVGVEGPGTLTDGSDFKLTDLGGNRGWAGQGRMSVPQHPVAANADTGDCNESTGR